MFKKYTDFWQRFQWPTREQWLTWDNRLIDACYQALMPYTCALCGARSEQDRDLCEPCEADMAALPRGCRGCAKPLPLDSDSMVCGACLQSPPAIDQCTAPYLYEDPIAFLIQQLKFNNQEIYSRVLGEILAEHIAQELLAEQLALPEYIVPVPLHKKRYYERGYNQAYEIALMASKHLSVPILERACEKTKNTTPQANLGLKHRAKNIKNAYVAYEIVANKHVAIVDDVMTTNATVNALAKALKKAGAKRVDAWAVCKTLKRDD